MDVKEIVNERLKRKYEFVLPFQEIAELENIKLEEVQSTAHIRGFRPGKVPMSLIKRRFGDAVRSNVLEEHSKSVLDEFLKSKDEKPITEVKLDHADREDENSDFVFTVDYECVPQITDVDLSSIELDKFVADLNDDFVDEAVRDGMCLHREFEDAPEGYAVKRGDRVIVTYRVVPTDDNTSQTDESTMRVLVEGLENNEKSRLEAKKFDRPVAGMFSALFDPYGMADHLIGLKVGDSNEFEHREPEGTLDSSSGKKTTFNIEIKSIERRLILSSQEDFARKLDYDSLAAYRLQLMANLKRYYDGLSKEILVEDLTRELSTKLEFDAPEALIDREIDFQKRRLEDSPPSNQGSRSDEPRSPESDLGSPGAEADSGGEATGFESDLGSPGAEAASGGEATGTESDPGAPSAEAASGGEATGTESDPGAPSAEAASGGEATDSESENRIRALAERRVKHFMFLEFLAGKHQITLESNEFLDFVDKVATTEEIRMSTLTRCQNDAAYRQNIMNMATTNKTMNFILELVKTETKKISPEELIKINEERLNAGLLDGMADAG